MDLTHWDRVVHMSVSKLVQMMACRLLGILLVRTLGTNFSVSEIQTFSLKNAFEYVVW